jgi:tetratricopeptide (TPR) repeat protein/tRNA A-37 threonylcarbamoyl transferase component Bud32
MRQRHACPNGHQWEVEGEAAARACPTCGQSPVSDRTLSADVVTVGLPGEPVASPSGLPSGLEHYEILAELGRGGMGVVYKARDRVLDRVVALKVILAGEFASDEGRRRLYQEAVTVAHLNHPNVIAIHQLAQNPTGVPYFVMEYCAGGTLAEKTGKPWPARDAATLVETLARAVAAAHDRGIVHRDLKPGNVLLDEHGAPKIADFGLARREGEARQTASGAIMGTPAYMAPEQASGKTAQIGPAADVWALGVILYELLAGKPPFHAEAAAETLVQIISDDPSPPRQLNARVPRDLETIALRCLQKEPAKRYGSAKDLADDLRRFLDGEPIKARPQRWWRRLSRRKRGWLKTGAVALLGAVVMMGLLTGLGTVRYYNWVAYDKQWQRFSKHRDKKEYDEAIAALTEAHRLRPAEADPLSHRGWAYHQAGKTDLALEDFEQALKRDRNHLWTYRTRGYILIGLHRYDEAVADLTRAIEIDPNVPAVYVNRANAYLLLQRFAQAEADLDRAAGFAGVNPDVYHARAIARAAQGKYADSVRDVEALGARGNVSGNRANVLFCRAVAALMSDDEAGYRTARDRLVALANATADPTESILAARACVAPTEPKAERQVLERLVEVGMKTYPNENFYRRVQAQVWLRYGKAEEALRQLEATLKGTPDYSPGLFRLLIALAHHKLGHKDDARRAYDQAVKDGVPVSHVHEALEYQLLLIEAKKTLAISDKPAP